MVAGLLAVFVLSGCYMMRPFNGAGQTQFSPPQHINAADIAVLNGYHIEPLARGLTFSTGVAFDDQSHAHVIESGYSYGEKWATPRLLRIEASGEGGLGPALTQMPSPRWLRKVQVRTGLGVMPSFDQHPVWFQDLDALVNYSLALRRHHPYPPRPADARRTLLSFMDVPDQEKL